MVFKSFGTVKTNKEGYAMLKIEPDVIEKHSVVAETGEVKSDVCNVFISSDAYAVNLTGNHEIIQSGDTVTLSVTVTGSVDEGLEGRVVSFYKITED